MKVKLTIFILFLSVSSSYSQVKITRNNFWVAKEFSKEISLFKSKEYLFREVLGLAEETVQFEVIPLAASSSGDLTTLIYKCDFYKREGLILGFYGDYWNDSGVIYQGYAFKHLEKNEATQFLDRIEKSIRENEKFLNQNGDNNNIYFKHDDMNVLIWSVAGYYKIRIFWQGFDSTWEKTAFERSKKRFEKKIN